MQMRPNRHSVLLDLHQDAKTQDALQDPTVFYTLDSAQEIKSRNIRSHKQTTRKTQFIRHRDNRVPKILEANC